MMNKSPTVSAVILTAFFTSLVTSVITFLVVSRLDLLPAEDTVAVPSLHGLSEHDARANLESRGLIMTIGERKSAPLAQPGTVLGQLPLAGSSVRKGSSVTVTLAQDMRSVPDVQGLSVAEATLLIEQAGFKLLIGNHVDHPSIQKEKIAAQLPKAGSSYETGRTVTVMQSNGPGVIPVPQLVGLALNKAKKTIIDAGFKVGKIRWTYNEDKGIYAVLNQQPSSGEKAKPGSVIDLLVNEE